MNTTNPAQNKIEALFRQAFITTDDYNNLTPEEKELFEQRKSDLLEQLQGKERSLFIDKIHPTLSADMNDEIWEINHNKICSVINERLHTKNCIPSKATIAKETGLSLVTVRKHLKEYDRHTINDERKERYRFMEQALITALYKKSASGDVNAMRLYFEITGLSTKYKEASVINNQHNYIQVNNFKLSQEEVQKLTQEQLLQIETIVRSQVNQK